MHFPSWLRSPPPPPPLTHKNECMKIISAELFDALSCTCSIRVIWKYTVPIILCTLESINWKNTHVPCMVHQYKKKTCISSSGQHIITKRYLLTIVEIGWLTPAQLSGNIQIVWTDSPRTTLIVVVKFYLLLITFCVKSLSIFLFLWSGCSIFFIINSRYT